MKLSKTVQKFTEDLKPYLASEPREEQGALLLILKESAIADREAYCSLKNEGSKLFGSAFSPHVNAKRGEVGFTLNREVLCAQELKEFFHPNIDEEHIHECFNYLVERGWTEKQFQSEIGIGRSTAWRYLTKIRAAKNGSATSQAETPPNPALPQVNMTNPNPSQPVP
jgi:hypothetical protein